MAIEDQILENLNGIETQFEKFNVSHDWVLAFTIGIFLASVFANVISFHFLHKQQKQMKLEFSHKTRPIIARHEIKKDTYVKGQENFDTYSIRPDKAMFHIINNGNMPAVKMSATFYLSRSNSIPVLDPQDKSHAQPISDLAPTEYYSIDIFCNNLVFESVKTSNDVYFGLLIWYHDDEENEYYYHMEGHFDKKALMLDYVKTSVLTHKFFKKRM